MKKVLRVAWMVILLILTVVMGYLVYVFVDYERIEDMQEIQPTGEFEKEILEWEETQTIVTYNIGYGAYSSDYTFFMDGGEDSRGVSEEEVTMNVQSALDIAKSLNPDIVLLQEVDTKADRSYDINQAEIVKDNFAEYHMMEAQNYDSAYLFYPITKPIGASKSELVTLSKYELSDGIRRSLPISSGFSKLFDLDRCYTVQSIKVNNGKKLYIYHVHLSAYGADDEIRDAQMQMLFDDMRSKLDGGNYVIAGGDFNHDFTGSSGEDFNEGKNVDFGWAQPFPEEFLGDDFVRATNYSEGGYLPTSRLNDIPYDPEKSTLVLIDGFIVSHNIVVETVKTVDTQFEYTDHMPVVMEFKLK